MSYEERKAILQKIENIIGEHCEAFVFIAKVDDSNGDECVMHQYEGGRAQALGLMRQTQLCLETEISDEYRKQDEEE